MPPDAEIPPPGGGISGACGFWFTAGAAYEWCLWPDDNDVVMVMMVVVSIVGESRHRGAQHQNTRQ